MGTSFIRTPRLDDAQQRSAKETPVRYAADILVEPNLTTWNAAVYDTQVDPHNLYGSLCCTLV
jgi:hypothetical protein